MARTKTPSKKSPPPRAAAPASESADDITPFLPAAKALGRGQVSPFVQDPELAYGNVKVGVESVLAERARITKELPGVRLDELASLPALASAVRQAAGRVDRVTRSKAPALLKEAAPKRRLLLKTLDLLAESGVLQAASVAKILAGRGPMDLASDLVDGAALLRKAGAPALAKTPLTQRDVDAADALGRELLSVLNPKGVAKAAPPGLLEALELRDRLGTLLVQRHDALWRIGAYLFGRAAVDARVPALGSRVVVKKKPKKTAEDAPKKG